MACQTLTVMHTISIIFCVRRNMCLLMNQRLLHTGANRLAEGRVIIVLITQPNCFTLIVSVSIVIWITTISQEIVMYFVAFEKHSATTKDLLYFSSTGSSVSTKPFYIISIVTDSLFCASKPAHSFLCAAVVEIF